MVPWVGMQCLIVVFTDNTHLPFGFEQSKGLFTLYVSNTFCVVPSGDTANVVIQMRHIIHVYTLGSLLLARTL